MGRLSSPAWPWLKYSQPAPPAIYRLRDSAVDETSGATVTLGPMSFTPGSTVLIAFATNSTGLPTITWGSQTASPGTITASGGGVRSYYYIANIGVGSNPLVIAFAAPVPTIKLVAVIELYRVAANSYSDHFAVGNDNGADVVSSVSEQPNHPETIFFGLIEINGPTTDGAGDWTNGYKYVFRTGTVGRSPDTDNRTMTLALTLAYTDSAPEVGIVWHGAIARTARFVGDGFFR